MNITKRCNNINLEKKPTEQSVPCGHIWLSQDKEEIQLKTAGSVRLD